MGKWKEKRAQKKKELEQKKQEELQKTQAELAELLEKISEIAGENVSEDLANFKLPTKKERILKFLMKYGLSFAIILGVTGFINWAYYNSIWYLILFSFIVVVGEIIISMSINYFLKKLVFFTLGLIHLSAPIVSFTLCALLIPFVEVANIGLLFLVIVIYIAVRSFMVSVFKTDNKIIIRKR